MHILKNFRQEFGKQVSDDGKNIIALNYRNKWNFSNNNKHW